MGTIHKHSTQSRNLDIIKLISKDALPDFLREFVREVKKNDGSIQDFDESNFAMTRRNEEAKGEVVCKGVEESDQKADKGLTACKITLT